MKITPTKRPLNIAGEVHQNVATDKPYSSNWLKNSPTKPTAIPDIGPKYIATKIIGNALSEICK